VLVATTDGHPAEAAIVYDTVYEPAVEDDGVIEPVVLEIVRPAVDEYVPPNVPVLVTP